MGDAMRVFVASIAVAFAAAPALAQPIVSVSENRGGRDVQSITWIDASGEPRSVAVLGDNIRIVRYAYTIGGDEIVDDEVPSYGIGNLVDHGGCDGGAVVSWESTEEYDAEAALNGPHHFIWRSTFRMPMCGEPARWRITNEYFFVTGEDHFIQTFAYDSSDLPEGTEIGDDMRGPYSQTTWPGEGAITGFGWGSEYRFRTTGAIPDGNAWVGGGVAVPWEWSAPNTIPYVWEWADPSQGGAVDREYGIVQNQANAEQPFGGGFYGCGGDCFASAPPLSGSAMPAAWALPSQMSSYDSNFRSGRITWGTIYGVFENGHANDTGTISGIGNARPINAWSFTHVIGAYSARGVEARVSDTENIYATEMTASTGAVITRGPRGPGDFVGPSVGEMPEIDYAHPGYDFIYRTWNVEADGGLAAFTLDVARTLARPTIVVHDFPSSEIEGVRVNSEDLAHENGYFASYDAGTRRLFVTIDRTLDAGENVIAIAAGGVELGDAGVGGPPRRDGGPGGGGDFDAGMTTPSPSGCGCRVGARDPSGWLHAIACAIALLRSRRRRR
jgi:hypothetical protein